MSKPIAIYIRRNTINGKSYVGQSVDPQYRWRNEFYEDYVLGYALRKYGTQCFDSNVLFWVETLDAANFWERYLIQLYGTLGPNGYNIDDGGSNGNPFAGKSAAEMEVIWQKQSNARKGKKATAETRRKMSESRQGDKHPMWGKKHTDDTKQQISDTMIRNGSTKGKNSPMWGKQQSVNAKQKISDNHADVSGDNNPMHRDNMKRRAGVIQLELFERED